ncbi:MAG: hypothetical protein ACI3T9_00905 [Romboutsia timonensis]
MKKNFIDWFTISGVWVLLSIILSVALIISVVDLSKENTKLKEEVASLKVEVDDKQHTIIERNQEIYRLEMIADEWKELFYSAIDFHPYEGPDW